jgi:hypothetical protein
VGFCGRRGDSQVLTDQVLRVCLCCQPPLTALRGSHLNCYVVEEGWAPLTYQELGAKTKEITLEEKGQEDGAVRVLEGHHD